MESIEAPQHGSRALGLGRAMLLAAAVGALGGMLYGVSENVRILASREMASARLDLLGLLASTAQAVALDAIAMGLLLALVGAAIWAAARSRNKALDPPALLGIAAAALTLILVRAGLWDIVEEPIKQAFVRAGRKFISSELWLISALSSMGVGAGVWAGARRSGHGRRLAGLALGLLSAAVVWSTWSLWLAGDGQTEPLRVSGNWPLIALTLIAGGIALGLYLLVAPATRGGRRQLLVGGALATVSVACLAGGTMGLPRRKPPLTRAIRQGKGTDLPRPTPPRNAPNVLWIVMDTARADALSCYGNPRKTTPHLDALAADATLYERAFTVVPWTLPSHASMFTGKLACRHGCTDERPWLDGRHLTVAELLARHGYRTFCCTANPFISPKYNLARGFDTYAIVSTFSEGRKRRLLVRQLLDALSPSDHGGHAATRLARAWIADCAEARQPFFVFLNCMEAHNPYGSTPAKGRWLPDKKALDKALAVSQDYLAYAAGARAGTPEDFAALRALYDGDMTYLDERIAGLIAELRSRNVLNDTLVIVTSDHGEELGEHGLLDHCFELYNTMLHVPLLIRYPGTGPRGTRCADIVHTTDLFPTVLEAVGIAWPRTPDAHGRSLFAPPASAPRHAVAERYVSTPWAAGLMERFPRWSGVPLWRRLRCVQNEGFKYVWASDGEERLFDLRSDPGETKNVIARHPDEARELRAVLAAEIPTLPANRGEATVRPSEAR